MKNTTEKIFNELFERYPTLNGNKEQIKSAFIMGQESTASQMLLYGRYLLMLDKIFDFDERVAKIENTSIEEVNAMAKEVFDLGKISTATVGPKRSPLKIV